MEPNDPASIADIQLHLYILGFFRFTEAVAWSSIFPYVSFMVARFPSVAEGDVAFWSGSLVAVFTFCEFLSGMIWARISDKIGRKPTLLIGLIGGMISALVFGFSRSLVTALVARAIGGLTNPNIGVIQTCVGELASRKEQQPKAFSIVPFLRGMGALIGPVLGGILANPCNLYPSLFSKDSLWKSYPYLLPNIAVICLSLCSFITGSIFLKETQRDAPQRPNIWSSLRTLIPTFGRSNGYGDELTRYTQLAGDDTDETTGKLDGSINNGDLELQDLPQQPGDNLDLTVETTKLARTFTPQVILQILSVSLLAFHKVSSDVIVPNFLALSADGSGTIGQRSSILRSNLGLGLDTQAIGVVLLMQAIAGILAQYFMIPRLLQACGPLKTYRTVLWVIPGLYLLTPFIAHLAQPYCSILVSMDVMVKIICSSIGYVCSSILITNTAPSKQMLAKINGAAASFGCLARAVGPLISGKLFGLGVKLNVGGLAFYALSGVAFIGAVESFLLRESA